MAELSKQVANRTFNREKFKTEYGLNTGNGDQRVRRYIDEITAKMPPITKAEMAILQGYCIENLTKKAAKHKLDSATELKIVLAGTTQEVKVKQEITEHKTVNINVKTLLSEYDSLFTNEEDENIRAKEATVSINNPK